jgi:serine/threonine-protein kinase
MSTMKRLFKRDNDIDTLKAIRAAHVPNPRDERPEFPEALWKIIDRALQRDPEARYQTAEEMRTDLDAFARGSAPHVPKVAELVSRLFPGGEARQAQWLRDAASVRIGTLAPPAPVPIASSSGLEGDAERQPVTLPEKAPEPAREAGKKPRTKKTKKSKKRRSTAKAAEPPPEENRRLWLIVGAVVVGLLLLAILTTR